MECSLSYSLREIDDEEIESGDEAQGKLYEESFIIKPELGESMVFPYRDIVELSVGNYVIHLKLTSNEKMTLFNLGYHYEDFLREFNKFRNDIILKDMLIDEPPRKAVKCHFVHSREKGEEQHEDECELRVHETSIVVIPEKREIFRVPYSYITRIQEDDYKLVVSTDFGEKITFSMMGNQFDSMKKAFSTMINELSQKTQNHLKDLLPEASPSVIRRSARFMKEGKAAKRSDIESISPNLWNQLENKLSTIEIKQEYNFLKSISQQEKLCIGLKRGLMGDLTGEYIWFLMPIYSIDPQKPGNAVAMEATIGEGGGKATYFFRLVSRKEYPNYKNLEDLHSEADHFIKKINRCMLEINFRREPIYLPDERLKEPRYEKYRFAVQRLPSLRKLRYLFIGRVSHVSFEQWKKDVLDLLRFNVATQDDNLKWKMDSS